ncbi:MAG: YqgE/AlgH family protein [bacterium]|nr:YqgE/AlgH family protein [bacterium]MDE0643411.1 YqgE/AlgH family protein [bacterium]
MSEEFESLAGQLLVAVPGMLDPNFVRTVVLMIEHSQEGAVGLVLNRPSGADLLDHLPGWWSVAVLPKVVFVGGPVGEGGGIGLARGPGTVPMEGWPEVLGIKVVDLESEPERDSPLETRIFAGYSGWGPKQLESELSSNGWFVVDAQADDVFTEAPETLWEEVLRRAGGRYTWFATYPADPRMN